MREDSLSNHIGQSRDLSFSSFVELHRKMEELALMQSAADYMEILFESTGLRYLSLADMQEMFRKRCPRDQADRLANEMAFKLNAGQQGSVSLAQVCLLCQKDPTICAQISQLYCQGIRQHSC